MDFVLLSTIIMISCVVILTINIPIMIHTEKELKKLDRAYDKLLLEIKYMRKEIKYSNNTTNYVINTTANIINNTNIVKNEINTTDKMSDFVLWLKSECDIVNGKYIIDKSKVAVMMDIYNKCERNIFHNDFMTIYGRYYITQKGINYIDRSKYTKSVFNDLLNKTLVITFYDDNEINTEVIPIQHCAMSA